MHRRALLAGSGFMIFNYDLSFGASVSLIDISNLGKALGDAAAAVGKLGDSISHIISLGQSGWDAVSARATRNRLRDIAARLTILNARSNESLLTSLESYVMEAKRGMPEPVLVSAWTKIRSLITTTLSDVQSLLGDLMQERSDLVTQTVYQDLISTLGGRMNLLNRISSMPAPTKPDEIAALQIASDNYKKLRENLLVAVQKINIYIRDFN